MIPRRAAIDSIETLQSELDLVNIWRIKNPQTRGSQWGGGFYGYRLKFLALLYTAIG